MRYSKKRKLKTTRKRNVRKQKKRVSRRKSKRVQKGGGPLSSIMSMVPFGTSGIDESFVDEEVDDSQTNQNVLVSALCNQYMKNNIRGNANTEYDAVLDSLCAGSQMSIPLRSNNVASNHSKKSSKKKVKMLTDEQPSQSGGVKIPSFLNGIKGLASIYSAPIRAGFKVVNSGINTIKDYSSKSKSKSKAGSGSGSELSTQTSTKTGAGSGSGSGSGSELSTQTSTKKYDIDSEIKQAESEIENESNKARDEVVSKFSENKNFDISEVLKNS
jgi:hypothetical protein